MASDLLAPGDAPETLLTQHASILPRSNSFSQHSETSQTAEDFITSQLKLEADAREALPYQFDTCTNALGPIRQSLYACLTCNPPPANSLEPYIAAGVCYSCSISCHGEHQLVELFTRRNFVCDCGTRRLPATSPCSLRTNPGKGLEGDVHSEEPSATNIYNQNFKNRFCGCGEEYDAHSEKGTMFQCLGLGSVENGGCGEDWWHPECIMGLSRDWYTKPTAAAARRKSTVDIAETVRAARRRSVVDVAEAAKTGDNNVQTESVTIGSSTPLETVHEEIESNQEPGTGATQAHPDVVTDALVTENMPEGPNEEEHPTPPGFPSEEGFDHFICFKCTSAFPWIKRYANAPGFLPAVPHLEVESAFGEAKCPSYAPLSYAPSFDFSSKRKADHGEEDLSDETALKKTKIHQEPVVKKARWEETLSNWEETLPAAPPSAETLPTAPEPDAESSNNTSIICRHKGLPPAPTERISLFLKPDFRGHICHCPTCFPLLTPHPALLEEEETYQPPLSSSPSSPNPNGDHHSSRHSAGSRSLLDRGEAALSNVDRVRAIEGVMVYNHLRDKVKDFLKPFAESGTPVGAEDIKKYFEKLRGDDEAIKQAQAGMGGGRGGEGEGSHGGKGQKGF